MYDSTPLGKLFTQRAGASIVIDPRYLEAVREDTNRGLSVLVEEARWYASLQHDDSTPEYQRVVVRSYRPHFIATDEELHEIVDDARRLQALKHEWVMDGVTGHGQHV